MILVAISINGLRKPDLRNLVQLLHQPLEVSAQLTVNREFVSIILLSVVLGTIIAFIVTLANLQDIRVINYLLLVALHFAFRFRTSRAGWNFIFFGLLLANDAQLKRRLDRLLDFGASA